jgi:cytochrome P450
VTEAGDGTVATQAAVDLTDVDLFVRGGHLDALATLRATGSIYWNEGADGSRFWALTTYADVLWAYREHTLFGSERGAILGGSFRNDGDTSAGRMLVASDLPRHRLLKQQFLPGLSAAVVSRVAAKVGDLVDRAVDRAARAGGCDFATDIATELPAGALMVIMGIDHREAHELIGLTRRMVGFRDEVFVDTGGEERLRLAWLQAEIFEFFADVLRERRARPGDDFVSLLFYNCMNLAVGGNETSSYTACSGVQAFAENTDQHELLLRNPDLLPSAIEEALRWSSTNAYVQRVAKKDVTRGAVQIRQGDLLTLWNVSANRDESQFPRPETFDITRNPNRHLSYGAGIHRCIGAPVAQAELERLFRRVLLSGHRFELIEAPRRMRSNFILGTTSMPVAIR